MEARRKASLRMAKSLQHLFAQLTYTNQKYVDPSGVLNAVVDDSGHQVPVGDQQDTTEYLLNFMERLEEGLGEHQADKSQHMRVSTYRKQLEGGDSNPHESFLVEDDETLATSLNPSEPSRHDSLASSAEPPSLPGYSHINDSYFHHAAPQERPPVQMKPLATHTNSIYENFFGSHITVTKLVNKESGEEKIISKHLQKMGPVMLDITNGRLMDDWEQSSRTEVSDYQAGASEVCINENWVKEPPNVLIFSLNRVKYDRKAQQLAKDFSRFEFDKLIHVDQLLEGNIGRIAGVRNKTQRLKHEIK